MHYYCSWSDHNTKWSTSSTYVRILYTLLYTVSAQTHFRLNLRGENCGSFGVSVNDRNSYAILLLLLLLLLLVPPPLKVVPAPTSTQLILYASSSDFLENNMRISVCKNNFPLLELANRKWIKYRNQDRFCVASRNEAEEGIKNVLWRTNVWQDGGISHRS